MNKFNLIKNLYDHYREVFHDEEIVLGNGSLDAEVLLIGEAPGKDEVKLNQPFVGAAGKNLSGFLDFLGLSRDEIYITNAIKYRLSKVSQSTKRLVNRPAKMDDIKKNSAFLLTEVEIINPHWVVTLGNVPLRALSGDMQRSIGMDHGQETIIDVNHKSQKVFPLYHPASIIYNNKLKEIYQQDLIALRKIVSMK